MRTAFILCAAALLAACDSPAELDDRWADPATITFAPSLNVDLSQMTRTATGLYWQDIVVGTGATAVIREPFITVGVHYTGWLPDGTVFDTSHDDNMPLPFLLGAGLVIRGWDEGIAGMKVGGKRRLVIPPQLAYGSRGKGPIPPLATLVFDVQLMWIKY